MSHYKINLSLNVLCPSAYICLQNLFKGLETLWRIVEVRNCLCQILNRVLLQKTLEMTESLCALIKIFFSLNDVIGGCIINKQIHSPPGTNAVLVGVLSVQSLYQSQSLSVRISAIGNNLKNPVTPETF